jgi:hypothetical protein
VAHIVPPGLVANQLLIQSVEVQPMETEAYLLPLQATATVTPTTLHHRGLSMIGSNLPEEAFYFTWISMGHEWSISMIGNAILRTVGAEVSEVISRAIESWRQGRTVCCTVSGYFALRIALKVQSPDIRNISVQPLEDRHMTPSGGQVHDVKAPVGCTA